MATKVSYSPDLRKLGSNDQAFQRDLSSNSEEENDIIIITLDEMIYRIESFKNAYPTNPDSVLYHLNVFTAPLPHETVDDASFSRINEAVQDTCNYIIKTHYPYCDDACQLFIIQAQSWVRYGTWYDYPQIFKFCNFALKCVPNLVQLQRISRLQNNAFSYKFKSQTESSIYHILKTWVVWNTFLTMIDSLYPLTRRQAEYDNIRFLSLGYIVDSRTGEIARDLEPFLNTPSYPVDLMTQKELDYMEEARKKAEKMPFSQGYGPHV